MSFLPAVLFFFSAFPPTVLFLLFLDCVLIHWYAFPHQLLAFSGCFPPPPCSYIFRALPLPPSSHIFRVPLPRQPLLTFSECLLTHQGSPLCHPVLLGAPLGLSHCSPIFFQVLIDLPGIPHPSLHSPDLCFPSSSTAILFNCSLLACPPS